MKAPTKSAAKADRNAAIADMLQITPSELRRLRRAVSLAHSQFNALCKAQRAAAVARQLSLTPRDLRLLQRALGGHLHNGERATAAAVVGRLATRCRRESGSRPVTHSDPLPYRNCRVCRKTKKRDRFPVFANVCHDCLTRRRYAAKDRYSTVSVRALLGGAPGLGRR